VGLSNLPPGVTTNMLPGNRPEDIAYDNLCEALAGVVPLSDEQIDKLAEWVSDKLDAANRDGYSEGVQETKSQCSMAAVILKLEKEWALIDKTSHEI
jgi:hypothetical protein